MHEGAPDSARRGPGFVRRGSRSCTRGPPVCSKGPERCLEISGTELLRGAGFLLFERARWLRADGGLLRWTGRLLRGGCSLPRRRAGVGHRRALLLRPSGRVRRRCTLSLRRSAGVSRRRTLSSRRSGALRRRGALLPRGNRREPRGRSQQRWGKPRGHAESPRTLSQSPGWSLGCSRLHPCSFLSHLAASDDLLGSLSSQDGEGDLLLAFRQLHFSLIRIRIERGQRRRGGVGERAAHVGGVLEGAADGCGAARGAKGKMVKTSIRRLGLPAVESSVSECRSRLSLCVVCMQSDGLGGIDGVRGPGWRPWRGLACSTIAVLPRALPRW